MLNSLLCSVVFSLLGAPTNLCLIQKRFRLVPCLFPEFTVHFANMDQKQYPSVTAAVYLAAFLLSVEIDTVFVSVLELSFLSVFSEILRPLI